jgi:CRP-like cAMP-binding protein
MAIASETLRNQLLAHLETRDYERLVPHLETVPLAYGEAIYEAGGTIEYAYFPTNGVISAVMTMANGAAIEVATIGNEGMAGLPALIESASSPNRMYVQIAGGAARISAATLVEMANDEGPLRNMFRRYNSAF